MVTSLAGTSLRAAMDTGMTIRGVTLGPEIVRSMVEKIAAIRLPDGVTFSINSIMISHADPDISLHTYHSVCTCSSL